MELGLSLGDTPTRFGFVEKPREESKGIGFCMGLSIGPLITPNHEDEEEDEEEEAEETQNQISRRQADEKSQLASIEAPLIQLDLLPHTPVPRSTPNNPHHRFPWLPSEDGSSEGGSLAKGLDVNRVPAVGEETEEGAEDGGASPTNAATSFQMEFSMYNNTIGGRNEGGEGEERDCSRGSDEDDNGSNRKKLRLSKEQSAFLEDSFKEHHTLNPKQKLALAKQLNLRPRQVEVWFQNRRARTKLKQTEVDCEYLKRYCETLTEENRRLQKELQELRALKSTNSFYMQLPATTLTMCPSCERVATASTASTATTTTTTTNNTVAISKTSGLSITRPRPYPFAAHNLNHPHRSTAS